MFKFSFDVEDEELEDTSAEPIETQIRPEIPSSKPHVETKFSEIPIAQLVRLLSTCSPHDT
jgi:hypothetical protein